MAKSLQERLASARDSDRTTIETLAKLIEDAGAEKDRLAAAHERASAESIDFALAEQDRDDAAANAARYARGIAGLSAAIIELNEKLEAKRNSDSQRAAKAEQAAALTERNEIAARFADRVPTVTGELVEILMAVKANAERLRMAGLHEANAEYHARGIAGNGMIGVTPALPFLQMKIPRFEGTDRIWPVEHNFGAQIFQSEANRQAQLKRAQEEDVRQREAAAEYARNHGRYEISSKHSHEYRHQIPGEIVEAAPNLPQVIAAFNPWCGVLPHKVAEKLQKADPNLRVERLDRETER